MARISSWDEQRNQSPDWLVFIVGDTVKYWHAHVSGYSFQAFSKNPNTCNRGSPKSWSRWFSLSNGCEPLQFLRICRYSKWCNNTNHCTLYPTVLMDVTCCNWTSEIGRWVKAWSFPARHAYGYDAGTEVPGQQMCATVVGSFARRIIIAHGIVSPHVLLVLYPWPWLQFIISVISTYCIPISVIVDLLPIMKLLQLSFNISTQQIAAIIWINMMNHYQPRRTQGPPPLQRRCKRIAAAWRPQQPQLCAMVDGEG